MKKRDLVLCALLLTLCALLCGCSGTGKNLKNGEWVLGDVDTGAYRKTEGAARVFYEIFVGSFSDSDGDGIGDLRGVINRMDYLNDGDDLSGLSLGVEGIWLTPIFQSPSYHKYDVADYYSVDRQFGSMEDLKELIALCHERNVKLIIDLPINHTSLQNAWFSRFITAHRQGLTDDEYYDFYSFYSAPDTAPKGRSFSQLSGTQDYYECNFSGDMPELNFDNEAVRTAVLDVAKYYLDLGIDGFRFDAAKYIYYGDNPASVSFWEWYLARLRAVNPDVITVAEVWDGDGVTDLYYPATDCFNFTVAGASGLLADAAKAGNVNRYASYVQQYLSSIGAKREGALMMPFLANHDTDRAAGYLSPSTGEAQMAANLLLLGPGAPFLYYGEEIGMRGSRGGAPTDADRRLAMIWGDDDTVSDPSGAVYNRANTNATPVKEQKADENSLYNYYKKLLLIRKANPEIAGGEFTALSFSDKAGGFTARTESGAACVLHNTTLRTITLDLSEQTDLSFTRIAAQIGAPGEDKAQATLEGTILTLPPQTSVVLRSQ